MATPERTINLGLSKAFLNKDFRPGYGETAWGNSFIPSTVTPRQWVDHALNGDSWTPGYFRGRTRTNETFISAQVLTLDGDQNVSVARALDDPIVRQYAALVHSTASSGKPDVERDPSGAPVMKSRIAFILSEPVEGAERWRVLARALMRMVDLPIDKASEKPAQPYHGSTNRIEHPYINLDAVLPIGLVAEFCYDEALEDYRRETAPKPVMVKLEGSRAEHYAAAAFDNALREITSAPAGERNSTLYSRGKRLYSMALGGWPGITVSAVETALEAIANGWPNARKSLSTIRSARKKAVAKPLELPENKAGQGKRRKSKVPRPFTLPIVNADFTVNLRYVGDTDLKSLPIDGALLVKSPIGTGKTRLAARLIRRLAKKLGRSPRVLVITHRQALAKDLTHRLNREDVLGGLVFECYKGLTGAQMRQIDRLVICLNSLPKLAVQGEKLPEYDLIIVDEIEQVLKHFDSRTFERGEAAAAYTVLRALARNAHQTVGMDAHAGETARAWLSGVLGKPASLLANTFTVEHGALVMHEDKSTLIREANRLIDEQAGVVIIPTNSLKRAKRLARYYRNRLGHEAVYLICSENSEGREAQDFIEHINDRLPSLRVFIYTPSLGTGVDIQARVRAVCAWFNAGVIDAPELHQMLGRARNAQETHVYIQDAGGERSTDWQAIYKRHELNAIRTGQLCPNDDGIFDIPDVQKSMLRLLSMAESERNASLNNLRGHFVALADGYVITERSGKDSDIAAALLDTDDQQASLDKEDVLAAAPITAEEYDRLRDQGELTPEHRAGREKDRMLQTAGLDSLTPEAYDDLYTPRQRAAVVQYADLTDTHQAMQAADREQARDGVLLNKRRHKTGKRILINRALHAVFGKSLDPATALTEAEINDRLQMFMECDYADLQRYFDDPHEQPRRADHSNRPLAVLRWILHKIGLKLVYRRVRRDGEPVYVYQLDAETLVKMDGYQASRLAMLARKRAEQEAEPGDPKPVLKTSARAHRNTPTEPHLHARVPMGVWAASSTPYLDALLG